MELDRADLRILAILQQDASIPIAAVAEQAGLTQSPCWRRIQRLRASGVLAKQVWLLDRDKAGLSAQVFAEVRLNAQGRENIEEFTKQIDGFPEVMECYVMMGSIDFLLRIVAKDIMAYEKFFFEKLSRVKGIQEISSLMALSEVKNTTSLPL